MAIVAWLFQTPSISHHLDALFGVFHGNVFLQTILGTTIAGSVLAGLRSAVTMLYTQVQNLAWTKVSVVASPNDSLFAAVDFYVSRHGKGLKFWSNKRTSARLTPVVLLTWQERLRALTASLSRQPLPRKVMLSSDTDPGASNFAPLFIEFEQEWVAVTSLPATSTYELRALGSGREDYLKRLLDVIAASTGVDVHGNSPNTRHASIYTPKCTPNKDAPPTWTWQKQSDLPPRNSCTLVLQGDTMNLLLESSRTFFLSSEEYAAKQQPFRRGVLLHGPPGTGKSTAAQVLATEMDMALCVLQLGALRLDDDALKSLMTSAPVPGFILLEDVDAASAAVKARPGVRGSPATTTGSMSVEATIAQYYSSSGGGSGAGLTLSGMLNALDGVDAHVGHQVIMTTNDVKALDPALIRPGRCDLVLELSFADSNQIRQLFALEFPDADPALANSFAACVVPNKFSPAAICAYLKRYKDAELAIAECRLVFKPTVMALPLELRTQSLYDILWKNGVETLFGDVVCLPFPAIELHSPSLHYFISQYQNGSLACKLLMRTLTASKHESFGFNCLTDPPVSEEQALACLCAAVALHSKAGSVSAEDMAKCAAAASSIAQFNAEHAPRVGVCMPRLMHHVLMNVNDVDDLTGDLGSWLLNYNRPFNANVRKGFTFWQLLHNANWSAEYVKTIMKALLVHGYKDPVYVFDNLNTVTSKRDLTHCGIPFVNDYSPATSKVGIVTRADIANLLQDAFDCSRQDAHAYAKSLCDVDGRQWKLSICVLRAYVSCVRATSVENCVKLLKGYIGALSSKTDDEVFAELQREADDEAKDAPSNGGGAAIADQVEAAVMAAIAQVADKSRAGADD